MKMVAVGCDGGYGWMRVRCGRGSDEDGAGADESDGGIMKFIYVLEVSDMLEMVMWWMCQI